MFDVHVTESPENYSIAVESTLSLDEAELTAACARADAKPMIRQDAAEDGTSRFRMELPKNAWPWGRDSLVENLSDHLLGMASHKIVWKVDGASFPNQATTVLWEMMKRNTHGAKHELQSIQAEWIHDVRSDEKLRRRTVVTWLHEYEFENRLKDRVERRLLLIGWIDSYLAGGVGAAKRFGTKNRLIRT
ncbi:MAG: hypothetical protein WBE26_12515 [Phycisphaerae bacterium]